MKNIYLNGMNSLRSSAVANLISQHLIALLPFHLFPLSMMPGAIPRHTMAAEL